jgi:hypothetical protein
MMLMMPPVPEAENCALGLVTTSMRAISEPWRSRSTLGLGDGRPSTRTVTPVVPSSWTVLSGATVTAGIRPRMSIALEVRACAVSRTI